MGAVLWGAGALAAPARAEAQALRMLACVEEAADGALLERVRGQTGDLAVRLVPMTCGLRGAFDAQLARATELAAARRAQLALWFVRRPPQLVVVVAELATARVLTRGLAQGAGVHAASARDESAALVVRSAVRAALAGVALDTPAAERAAVVTGDPAPVAQVSPATPAMPTELPEESPPAPEASPPPPEPPAPERAASAPKGVRTAKRRDPPRAAVWLAARAQGGVDGFARSGRYAFGGRLGVRVGRLEAGLGGLAGMVATRDVALGTLSLARHRVGVYGAVALVARATLRATLELEGGAELTRLQVRRADARLEASSTRSVLAFVAAYGRLAFLPAWGHGRLALAPAIGVVALPERAALGYRANGTFVRVRRLYVVEPVVELALAARF